jgi:hypothetical protein
MFSHDVSSNHKYGVLKMNDENEEKSDWATEVEH